MRHHLRPAALLAALMLQLVSARAEGVPKVLVCAFERGTTTSFAGGEFKQVPAERLAFEISNVDLDGQTAQLAGSGSGKAVGLKMVRALNANHFLEVVNEGFLNLTTVYDRDSVARAWPAVHSRHFGLLGQPMVAHYQGFCRAKE